MTSKLNSSFRHHTKANKNTYTNTRVNTHWWDSFKTLIIAQRHNKSVRKQCLGEIRSDQSSTSRDHTASPVLCSCRGGSNYMHFPLGTSALLRLLWSSSDLTMLLVQLLNNDIPWTRRWSTSYTNLFFFFPCVFSSMCRFLLIQNKLIHNPVIKLSWPNFYVYSFGL